MVMSKAKRLASLFLESLFLGVPAEVHRHGHLAVFAVRRHFDPVLRASTLRPPFSRSQQVLQLGFLLKFLGHPVVSGFSTGSALVIMQLRCKGRSSRSAKDEPVEELLGSQGD